MHKTFLYRLYPTRKQATLMACMLEQCRWLYNHLLAERKNQWDQTHTSLTLYDQHATLPPLKKAHPSLKQVHSQVLQNVAARVDIAFKAFFRRLKAGGEEPGYPRFRGKGRYDSMCYPQHGNGAHLTSNTLYLSKVGPVRVVLHRPLEGTAKTVVIKRSSTGKWYVTISCEWEPAPLPPCVEKVGIDVGLATFATLSTGEQIANPRFFRTEQKALAKAQRCFSRMSKDEKGTPQRAKRRKVVARVHERTAWRRDDFTHQHSRRIVDGFGLVVVEELQVSQMMHNHNLAKSIADAAWSGFLTLLGVKAGWAGTRQFVRVNPAYTSQTCSGCGHRLAPDKRLGLSDRVFECPDCNLHIDRDLNAALVIVALGQQCLASA